MDIISVGLQKSLVATQHKLWMAIKEHQKCSQKLSGNPNDPQDKHLQARMKMIEIKILEIDRWQKDLYCQLRKEIAALNSETALHETKLWLAEALQLNNNHIIRNGSNASLVNGHASSSSNVSEDEEPPPPPQQNGVTASPFEGQHSPTSFKQGREASTSGSADEEAECSPEALSEEETPGASLAVEAENKKCFLGRIGLISHERLGEIERRRNQRKRRSNVRSQFLYSAPQPPKRKRYAYLQSGNAPQTRQTTARLNGPSPTPTTKSTGRGSGSSKQSTSSKPLIQPAKTAAATGGSVMRNGEVTKHKEFSIKQKTDNGNGTMKISSTGKTVHIPGLPSSLTVEWIDKDSTVCVSCRNPGSLTMCEACAAKFHVSCHTTSPVSTSHCPKCVTRFPVKAIGSGNDLEILRHEVKHVKKEYRDKGAAGESSRAHGKGGENSELHKALGELYKADAAQARQQQQQSLAAFDIKQQLPSSTLLIPITSSAVTIASTATASHDDDNSNFGSNSGFGNDMAEIVRQLPETSVTTGAASRNEWRRLALQSSGLVQRRSSNAGTSIHSKQSISILHHEGPDGTSRSTSSERHKYQRHTYVRRFPNEPPPSVDWIILPEPAKPSSTKPRNYVTVEVTCSDHDNRTNDAASKNSADGYTVSESTHGVPDLIDLEPQPRVEEPTRQEPEVFNVSSGSSELNTICSSETELEPQPELEAESTSECKSTATTEEKSSYDDLETAAKSPESTPSSSKQNEDHTTDVARQSPAPKEHQQQKQSVNVGNRDFLSTVFPGEFGYRIVIQYDPRRDISSSDDGADGENTNIEYGEQQQHVKLEEAHLPAPLGPELKTAVPNNKSDAATSQDFTSVEKPTEQSEPIVTAD
ncbi:uncharacterized protein LOC131671726 isoform X2 [Phymastichus coffea]|uniref:uncharacterized protein LOC131671726 isoform X2 n=1 Tax=Phymastichus coffea TaxID=108790 RepID=UPI00273CF48E|nr:uncharacterized protein LOC131671726 isoform X2 [Phymastichus coffea]